MVHETIGQRVAKRRREMGLSQMQLAVNCVCTLSTITKIEQGETKDVSQSVLEKLSDALGLSLDVLVKGTKSARRT